MQFNTNGRSHNRVPYALCCVVSLSPCLENRSLARPLAKCTPITHNYKSKDGNVISSQKEKIGVENKEEQKGKITDEAFLLVMGQGEYEALGS